MTGDLVLRPQIYQSRSIIDRRRKILQETRNLIGEFGSDGFSIREICDRAGISQKTLYNNFGSKEGVIASAIYQSLVDFHVNQRFHFEGTTLRGRLERAIRIRHLNLHLRPYAVAIISIYNSLTAGREIREAMRKASTQGLEKFAVRMEAEGMLASGVTAHSYLENAVTISYALLTDWAFGSIEDKELIDRGAEGLLSILLASTQGSMAEDAAQWLEKVRSKDASWLTLREISTSEANFAD
jgi:AcrR family transcriptional regulator